MHGARLADRARACVFFVLPDENVARRPSSSFDAAAAAAGADNAARTVGPSLRTDLHHRVRVTRDL